VLNAANTSRHDPAPEQKTLDVPTAGRIYFGLSPEASYRAVRRGQIPAIRIGKMLRVPIILLDRMLENASL